MGGNTVNFTKVCFIVYPYPARYNYRDPNPLFRVSTCPFVLFMFVHYKAHLHMYVCANNTQREHLAGTATG